MQGFPGMGVWWKPSVLHQPPTSRAMTTSLPRVRGCVLFPAVHRSVVSHSCRKRFLFYALMVSSAKSVHIQSLSGGRTFAAFDCRVSLPCQETGAIATGRDFVDAVDGDESNALLEGNNDEDDEHVMGSPAAMHEHPDVLKAVVASMQIWKPGTLTDEQRKISKLNHADFRHGVLIVSWAGLLDTDTVGKKILTIVKALLHTRSARSGEMEWRVHQLQLRQLRFSLVNQKGLHRIGKVQQQNERCCASWNLEWTNWHRPRHESMFLPAGCIRVGLAVGISDCQSSEFRLSIVQLDLIEPGWLPPGDWAQLAT